MVEINTPWEDYNIEGYSVRVKREDLSCPHPGPSFSKIRGIEKYIKNKIEENLLPIKYIGVVDTFHSKAGWVKIVQKDIYNGAIIEIKESDDTILSSNNFKLDSFGMRTLDFKALFSFEDTLTFSFQESFCLVNNPSKDFQAILSGCVYDELYKLEDIKEEA